MIPRDLTRAHFAKYPPEARQLATANLGLLQTLPLAFLPLLLREVLAYDWKFPAERKELDHQFAFLGAMSPEQLREAIASFDSLRVPRSFEDLDWVNAPGQFSEQLSAHLWSSHQIDTFRAASIEYVKRLNAAAPRESLPMPRLAIAVIGRGVGENRYPLFRKLRPYGVYFQNVDPANGRESILKAVTARSAAHPTSFAHWYIDGDTNEIPSSKSLACICFSSLESARASLVQKMRATLQSRTAGPEALRTMLAQMRPDDLGLSGEHEDAVLNRFQVSVLTEGSGTQLFSTTFVQWSAREVLRRAQPLTLLARFTPRQHEQSMRELVAGVHARPIGDPDGSLIDADMGAYYTWINQQRLADAEKASFLVWFEDHSQALAIGPSLPRGTQNDTPMRMSDLLKQIS
ncbi:MAG: hypothetical protein ACJ746_17245 [Bryobacteraceae bacterium]